MPVNLVGVISERLAIADEDALEELGKKLVMLARSRAPVRKGMSGPRQKKTGRPLGLTLAARRYVRRVAVSGRFNRAQFQAFRFQVLHGKVQVPRKLRQRQPLILGSYAKDRPIRMTDAEKVRAQSHHKKMNVEVSKEHTVPYARKFRPAKGVQLEQRLGKFKPIGAFRSALSYPALKDIERGRGITKNERGQLQYGGRLKASIEVSELTAKHVVVEADPEDENGRHYARYVEFPTSRTAAQPFLLPALKDVKKQVRATFEAKLREQGLMGKG